MISRRKQLGTDGPDPKLPSDPAEPDQDKKCPKAKTRAAPKSTAKAKAKAGTAKAKAKAKVAAKKAKGRNEQKDTTKTSPRRKAEAAKSKDKEDKEDKKDKCDTAGHDSKTSPQEAKQVAGGAAGSKRRKQSTKEVATFARRYQPAGHSGVCWQACRDAFQQKIADKLRAPSYFQDQQLKRQRETPM